MTLKTMIALTIGVLSLVASQAQAQWQVKTEYGGSLSCQRSVVGGQPVATVGNFALGFPTPVGNTLLAPLSNGVAVPLPQNGLLLFNGYLRDRYQSTQHQDGYFSIDVWVEWVGLAPAPASRFQLELWANKTRMDLPNWNDLAAVAQLSTVTLTNVDNGALIQSAVAAPNFVVGGPANQFSTGRNVISLPVVNGRGHFRINAKESLYMKYQGGGTSIGACETRITLALP